MTKASHRSYIYKIGSRWHFSCMTCSRRGSEPDWATAFKHGHTHAEVASMVTLAIFPAS